MVLTVSVPWELPAPVPVRTRGQDGIDIYFSTLPNPWPASGPFFAAETGDRLPPVQHAFRSLPSRCPPIVKGAQVRLDLLKQHPEMKARLWENVNALSRARTVDWNRRHQYLRHAGLPARRHRGGHRPSCTTLEGKLSDLLLHGGLSGDPERIILRLILTAMHTPEDIAITWMPSMEVVKAGYCSRLAAAATARIISLRVS